MIKHYKHPQSRSNIISKTTRQLISKLPMKNHTLHFKKAHRFKWGNLSCQNDQMSEKSVSQSGSGFQKIFENFVDLFLRSTKLIFSGLSEDYKNPILTNSVFGYILKNFTKFFLFLGARSHSKFVNIGAEGAFRKL